MTHSSDPAARRLNHTGPFDAVICDIDGCLNDEHGSPLDLEPLSKIAAWNRRAESQRDRPIVVPCSGRPISYVECIARHIACTALPIIGEMGAWLFFPDTNRHELDPAITADDLRAVTDLAAFGRDTLGSEGVTIQPGKAASVTFWHADTAHLREAVAPRVERLVAERGWPFRVSMTWFYINCDLAHVSKATGIDRFLRHTGLNPARIAGIGDTMSDLAIRERVAWFGCPANAAEGLKSHADAVAETTEAHGVNELLSMLEG
ncbi:MAG: HAD hydrolase family protein [Planctomycetota bacterium]